MDKFLSKMHYERNTCSCDWLSCQIKSNNTPQSPHEMITEDQSHDTTGLQGGIGFTIFTRFMLQIVNACTEKKVMRQSSLANIILLSQ